MMQKYKLAQSGDTIVEVLISIAVIGAVLLGAFVATDRDIQSIEDASEHQQATKIVDSQIEALYSYLNTTPTPRAFDCFEYSTSPAALTPEISSGPVGLNHCIFQSNNTKAAANSHPAYSILITKSATSGLATTYTVTATWESAFDGKTATVSMEYRAQ